MTQEQQRLHAAMRHRFQILNQRVSAAGTQLRLLGPEQVLARGYSITRDASTGEVIRDPAQVAPGQEIKTRLRTGEIRSRVETS